MKKILSRLKSKKGETLVESMAGILIFTFGSIIMLSMITSAADINTAAKEADRQYFEDMVVVEMANAPSANYEDPKVSFTVKPKESAASISSSEKVDVYAGPGGLYAYYKVTPAEGGGT